MSLTLAQMRSLFYVFISTPSTDPQYPLTTVDLLINAAAGKFYEELRQANPGWSEKVATILPTPITSNLYFLPSDFASYLDIRLTDSTGYQLDEVRPDEINSEGIESAFAIYGGDEAATLQTSAGVTPGIALYVMYSAQPVALVNTGDIPTWMPDQFHEIIPRQAAIDGFGLGAEGRADALFIQETNDRIALFWQHISRRGTQGFKTRATL